MEVLWLIFDIVGTVAFAISGALAGISRRMDIFGIFVLAAATSIGGGIIRDMMTGLFPPNAFKSFLYVGLTIVSVLVVFFLYRSSNHIRAISTRKFRHVYLWADAIGLASFTITGTSIGIMYYPQYSIFSVLLGLLTAVGGGVVRDVLAQRIPSILREDVYAMPALLGSILYYYIASAGYWYMASYVAFSFVFIIRVLAMYYHWSLPKAHR